jgi:hypothetical protein
LSYLENAAHDEAKKFVLGGTGGPGGFWGSGGGILDFLNRGENSLLKAFAILDLSILNFGIIRGGRTVEGGARRFLFRPMSQKEVHTYRARTCSVRRNRDGIVVRSRLANYDRASTKDDRTERLQSDLRGS